MEIPVNSIASSVIFAASVNENRGGWAHVTFANYCDILITFHIMDNDIMPLHGRTLVCW